MSPEQAEGKPVDPRSDVFSLGVLLYELATGQRPFVGDTSASVISAILRDTPPQVTTLRPELPRDVARIVTRALQKDPEHRYQTAKDLRNDLEGLKAELDAGRLESSASAAAREAAAAPAVSGAWTRRAWLGLAAALLVVAGAIGAWRWTRPPAPVPTTPAENADLFAATESLDDEAALDPKRIAVAIFENRTGDASLDSLGQLAAERISERLPQISTVQVVPPATFADFARHDPGPVTATSRDPVQQLAAATGSGLVVSGAFHIEGNDLRVRARLTDATTGTFVLVEPEPVARATPMKALDETRDRVMGAVAVKLDPVSTVMMMGTAPKYQAFQEWRAANEIEGAEGLKRLRRALDLDPTFTAARISLLGTYDDPGEDARQLEIVEQQRGRMSPAQQHWLASLRAELAGRNEEAYTAARAAAALAPPSTALNLTLAIRAAAAGHFRAAVEALSAPLDWRSKLESSRAAAGDYFYKLAESLHWLGEHERELAEVRRGRSLRPDIMELRLPEAIALAALGRVGEIDGIISEGLTQPGLHAYVMCETAEELRRHGHREASVAQARRVVDWYANLPLEQRQRPEWRLPYTHSLRHLDRWDEARPILDALAREGTPGTNLEALGQAGVAAVHQGDRGRAQRIFGELGRVSDDPRYRGWRAHFRASIAAHLGDEDRAVELLRLSLAQGATYDYHLHHALELEPLRGYPPFEALIKPKD